MCNKNQWNPFLGEAFEYIQGLKSPSGETMHTSRRNILITITNAYRENLTILMTPSVTKIHELKRAAADRNKTARLTETVCNHLSSTKQLLNVWTLTQLRPTSDLHKTNLRLDTGITLALSATKTPRNSTEFSKHIWTLKDNNVAHDILWNIITHRKPYNSANKRCKLCLKENFSITYQPQLTSLNKLNELISSCRHRHKALLSNLYSYT